MAIRRPSAASVAEKCICHGVPHVDQRSGEHLGRLNGSMWPAHSCGWTILSSPKHVSRIFVTSHSNYCDPSYKVPRGPTNTGEKSIHPSVDINWLRNKSQLQLIVSLFLFYHYLEFNACTKYLKQCFQFYFLPRWGYYNDMSTNIILWQVKHKGHLALSSI